MKPSRLFVPVLAFVTAITLSHLSPSIAFAGEVSQQTPELSVAQPHGEEPRELQPRYEPEQPQPRGSFNNEYIFGISRGVTDSSMHPALKVLILPITVPLDIVFLPFEIIGGLLPS